eukprot:3922419-Ditylum_brightwellii.AAC.1
MVEEVVGAIKSELDEHNIGGGYNITHLMEFFRAQSNKVIDQINCLQGTAAQVEPCKERSCLFESCPLHSCSDKLQGLPCDWVMPRMTLNGAILM